MLYILSSKFYIFLQVFKICGAGLGKPVVYKDVPKTYSKVANFLIFSHFFAEFCKISLFFAFFCNFSHFFSLFSLLILPNPRSLPYQPSFLTQEPTSSPENNPQKPYFFPNPDNLSLIIIADVFRHKLFDFLNYFVVVLRLGNT